MEEIKPQLTTLEKFLKTTEKLNNNQPLQFDYSQEHYYLVYDYNTKSIMQLTSRNSFKIQGVVYCLNLKFKEKAIEWIGEDELREYLTK